MSCGCSLSFHSLLVLWRRATSVRRMLVTSTVYEIFESVRIEFFAKIYKDVYVYKGAQKTVKCLCAVLTREFKDTVQCVN